MLEKIKRLPFHKAGSLLLRTLAMGSKFVIFTYLSKYFSEQVYGVYSLMTTTVTIAIFLLGLDFYNYAIRDILVQPKDRAAKVASSFFLYGMIYIAFFLIGYPVFKQISYLSEFTVLIIIIAISEHLNQEIYRLLVAFRKVLFANWLLFFRVAGWTIWVLFKIIFLKQEVSLGYILSVWMIFNVSTIVVTGIWFLLPIKKAFSEISVKKDWLKKGLKISMIFYAATMALKVIEYSNRYIVEFILDETATGIFSFYSNISMIIGLYINTIVISYELPDLIESSTTDVYQEKAKRFKKLLITHSLIAFVIVLLFTYPVLLWQEKSSFMEAWPLIILLGAGAYFMNVSLSYHSFLYIEHQEVRLLRIVLVSSAINVVATLILTYFAGIIGTGIAFLITGIAIFALRKRAVKLRLE